MEVLIENRKHKVIYIEYQDDIPFSVVTIFFVETAKVPYWRPERWDFYANKDDKNDIKAYSSGSGGDAYEIQSPQYIDKYLGAKYWMEEGVKFDSIERNITKLKEPISNGFKNPFDIAEITDTNEYCDRCGYYSDEFCFEHKYEDNNFNVRYKDDDSYE